jgi:hypothetical protein
MSDVGLIPRGAVRHRVTYAAAFAMLVLEVAGHLVDFRLDDLRVRLLDASQEWSWSHIAATVAFAASAVVCALAARRARAASRRREWWLLAGLFGILLTDNVTRAHEAVPQWPLLVAPAVACVGVVVVRLARGTPVLEMAVVALGLLLVSFAIHVLGHALVHSAGWSPQTWAYQIKVALKEGTELAGWMLLVPVLMRLAARP